jgi:hypothetical protein
MLNLFLDGVIVLACFGLVLAGTVWCVRAGHDMFLKAIGRR